MIDTDKYEELLENGMQHRDLWELATELLAEVKRFNEMKKWLLENHTQVMLQYTYGEAKKND